LRTAVVLGTRPEIIKLSPVIRALAEAREEHIVVHTGQHYSYDLDGVFFENLGLGQPAFNLQVGSGTHAEETGRMMIGIEKVLRQEGVAGVLVEGDTNTVLAGALAAAKLHVKVGHVEAGLRSFDRRMPEEINRVLADHVSDLLFAPTAGAKANLRAEGVDAGKVFVTGNTIVDAVRQNAELAEGVDLGGLTGQVPEGYLLATVHREENVDVPARLRGIIGGLEAVAEKTGSPVVYPVHPRAAKAIRNEGILVDTARVRMTPPVDYFHFLGLERGSRLILTDSGGVQEEACILGVPCVTLRDNTERPETVRVGANTLAGTDPASIVRGAAKMLKKRRRWRNPFGDGRAGKRIAKLWAERLE
jgi:UDP-N-acetylglucosamine 2-epimerase (non-hydrolysing)